MASVSPSQVDRFRADLKLLIDGGRIGVAVSGGPDSMALLRLAAAALPGRVEAATVDHGLRPEAVDEAKLVASVCQGLGVRHEVLTVAVQMCASIQAAARDARYAALSDWASERGIAAVATAHHADDQAETLLMRFLRGAGLSGLSGIRARRDLDDVLLVRPLLAWRRAELAAMVSETPFVIDPSNADTRHDRTQMREALALLGDRIDPVRLSGTAAHLDEADAALDWLVGEAIRGRVERLADNRISADLEGLPREVRRRILARLIGEADSPVDGPTLDTAMVRLEGGQVATLGRLKMSPGRRITIEKAPLRR